MSRVGLACPRCGEPLRSPIGQHQTCRRCGSANKAGGRRRRRVTFHVAIAGTWGFYDRKQRQYAAFRTRLEEDPGVPGFDQRLAQIFGTDECLAWSYKEAAGRMTLDYDPVWIEP